MKMKSSFTVFEKVFHIYLNTVLQIAHSQVIYYQYKTFILKTINSLKRRTENSLKMCLFGPILPHWLGNIVLLFEAPTLTGRES